MTTDRRSFLWQLPALVAGLLAARRASPEPELIPCDSSKFGARGDVVELTITNGIGGPGRTMTMTVNGRVVPAGIEVQPTEEIHLGFL